MAPMVATPRPASPNVALATMPSATTPSAAGKRGTQCLSPRRTTTAASETAKVRIDVSGSARASPSKSRKKPTLWRCSPSSFGSWSTTMTAPIPALNPASTGSEMKLATKPSLATAARISINPTSNESVASAAICRVGATPGTASASAGPVRMAMVVVVLTLSTGERPRAA